MTRTSDPDFEDGTLNAYLIRPDEVEPGDCYGYKVVAVVFNSGFYAAYRGPTAWSDEQVAEEGDAVSEEVASRLFPSIASACVGYNS